MDKKEAEDLVLESEGEKFCSPPSGQLLKTVVVLKDKAVLRDKDLTELGFASGSITRARKEGKLRYARVGNQFFYLGTWVLEWLWEISVQDAVAAKEDKE